jgi:hypothetical protein
VREVFALSGTGGLGVAAGLLDRWFIHKAETTRTKAKYLGDRMLNLLVWVT